MKVNELWLKNFVKTDLPVADLAECLTQGGIEVDGIEYHDGHATFVFKIPPNRGDCLSVAGVAREVACLTQASYQSQTISPVSFAEQSFPVRVDVPKLCPCYRGCVIENVDATQPSPQWLREKLASADINSVSAIVDVLNYVMIELGQPLHAFDRDKLDQELVVRMAKPGETLVLLDEKNLELNGETLVIADQKGPQAIAGIMGGLSTSVTDNTQTVLIESAYFDPVCLRLAGQAYVMKTDALYRFERGVDPNLSLRALTRAVSLLVEVVGGVPGALIEKLEPSLLPTSPTVTVRTQRISKLLGVVPDSLETFFQRLDFDYQCIEDGYQITPPSYRQDIRIEADVIEEIARLIGLHQLPSKPLSGVLSSPSVSEQKNTIAVFQDRLMARGYHEVVSYSFIDREWSVLFDEQAQCVTLQNPIAAELAVMRTSLWPGLLSAIQYNQNRQFSRVRLFESGRTFHQEGGDVIERECLAGMCVGSVAAEQWGLPLRHQDFYDSKADVEALCDFPVRFEPVIHSALHPGQSASIVREGSVIGYLGVLHPRIMQALKMTGPVVAFELQVDRLAEKPLPRFSPLSKFPTIRRDLAFLVDESITVAELMDVVKQTAGASYQAVYPFDVYQGQGVAQGKKSIAFALILGDPLRTLTEEEANSLVQDIVSQLHNQKDAVLRD